MRNPALLVREFTERVQDQFVAVSDGTITAGELPDILHLIAQEFVEKHTANLLEIMTIEEGEKNS